MITSVLSESKVRNVLCTSNILSTVKYSCHALIQRKYRLKVNVSLAEVIEYYAMKTYLRSGCIHPHFLDLGTVLR
jgi:hypothetical protein